MTLGDENTDIEGGQATIGATAGPVSSISWDRPEVQKSDTTINVPQDESTIQDALRKVPRRLVGDYTISIDEGQGPFNEDLVIPPVHSEDLTSNTEGGNTGLKLNTQGGGNVTVSSVFAVGGVGQKSLVLVNIHADSANPWDDEGAPFAFYGWKSAALSSCAIASGGSGLGGGSNGILSYTSQVKVETSFDWGADLVETGGRVKQMGELTIDSGVTASGSVTGDGYVATSGAIEHRGTGPTVSGEFASDPNKNNRVTGRFLQLFSEPDGTARKVLRVEADGDVRLSDSDENSGITLPDGLNLMVVKKQMRVDDGAINFNDSTEYDDTDDSMTADPETDAESGYINIEVGGTTKQIPFYDP